MKVSGASHCDKIKDFSPQITCPSEATNAPGVRKTRKEHFRFSVILNIVKDLLHHTIYTQPSRSFVAAQDDNNKKS